MPSDVARHVLMIVAHAVSILIQTTSEELSFYSFWIIHRECAGGLGDAPGISGPLGRAASKRGH